MAEPMEHLDTLPRTPHPSSCLRTGVYATYAHDLLMMIDLVPVLMLQFMMHQVFECLTSP